MERDEDNVLTGSRAVIALDCLELPGERGEPPKNFGIVVRDDDGRKRQSCALPPAQHNADDASAPNETQRLVEHGLLLCECV
jgi:hypothetical protein